ncbi:hypothetical protein CLF_113054 [Clonorchis sinensis]|uniref:Uncharacterized protein n=1 Tax=Clonorchis sinensis TaxID=79923 RepID=G7YXI7_CLOSI|nr:hypothetical protein CLF_113054 [Clonorchis sinensis]
MPVSICDNSLANRNYNNNPKRLTQDVHETPCALNGPQNTLNACRSQFVTIPWRIVTTITTLNDSPKEVHVRGCPRTQVRRCDDGTATTIPSLMDCRSSAYPQYLPDECVTCIHKTAPIRLSFSPYSFQSKRVPKVCHITLSSENLTQRLEQQSADAVMEAPTLFCVATECATNAAGGQQNQRKVKESAEATELLSKRKYSSIGRNECASRAVHTTAATTNAANQLVERRSAVPLLMPAPPRRLPYPASSLVPHSRLSKSTGLFYAYLHYFASRVSQYPIFNDLNNCAQNHAVQKVECCASTKYRQLRGDLILTYALFEQGLTNRFFTVDATNTLRGHDERKALNDSRKLGRKPRSCVLLRKSVKNLQLCVTSIVSDITALFERQDRRVATTESVETRDVEDPKTDGPAQHQSQTGSNSTLPDVQLPVIRLTASITGIH